DAAAAELRAAAQLVADLRAQRSLVDLGPVWRRASAVPGDRRCDRARSPGHRNRGLLAAGLAVPLGWRAVDGVTESLRSASRIGGTEVGDCARDRHRRCLPRLAPCCRPGARAFPA